MIKNTIGRLAKQGVIGLLIAPFLCLADWIPPEEVENAELYYSSYNSARRTDLASVVEEVCYYLTPYSYRGSYYDCAFQGWGWQGDVNIGSVSFKYIAGGGNEAEGSGGGVRREYGTALQCTDPAYPIPHDSDADGQIDQCHTNFCPAVGQGEVFPANGVSGAVCVPMPDGSTCRYNSSTATDSSGANVGEVLLPSGEACISGRDDHLPTYNPYSTPEGQFDNPPPSGGGCSQINGGLYMCSADQGEMCPNGQCPQNCGTVNGQFVCLEDSNGEGVETGTGNASNDNSDNQASDDPNTQADEGTHSRLDGVLENTDEIEALLRQIRDKLPDKLDCGSGYQVGDKCVNFNGKDDPTINDLDTQQLETEISDAQTALNQKINEIKAAFSSKFNIGFSGAGSYESRTVNVFGVSVDMGLGRIMQHVDLGAIVIFICSVWAAFIILSGRAD